MRNVLSCHFIICFHEFQKKVFFYALHQSACFCKRRCLQPPILSWCILLWFSYAAHSQILTQTDVVAATLHHSLLSGMNKDFLHKHFSTIRIDCPHNGVTFICLTQSETATLNWLSSQQSEEDVKLVGFNCFRAVNFWFYFCPFSHKVYEALSHIFKPHLETSYIHAHVAAL